MNFLHSEVYFCAIKLLLRSKICFMSPEQLLLLLSIIISLSVHAQTKDSVEEFETIIVTGYKTINGIGRLTDVKDGVIYSGKKTEVLLIDSIDANKAYKQYPSDIGKGTWAEYCGNRKRRVYCQRDSDQRT